MKHLVFSIIVTLFLVSPKLPSFAHPASEQNLLTFTDAEIAHMPSLQGITPQTVIDLQKESVVLNGRQWQFIRKNDPDRDAIIKDGPETFGIQSYPAFRLPLFSLHKNGIWVSPIRLVHNTAMITNEDGSRQRQCYNVDIFTQLSEQEQTLPLFQRLIYPEAYEECLDFDVHSPDYLQLTTYQFSIFTCCLREELSQQTLVNILNGIGPMKHQFDQRRTPENSETLDALLRRIDMMAEALKEPKNPQ